MREHRLQLKSLRMQTDNYFANRHCRLSSDKVACRLARQSFSPIQCTDALLARSFSTPLLAIMIIIRFRFRTAYVAQSRADCRAHRSHCATATEFHVNKSTSPHRLCFCCIEPSWFSSGAIMLTSLPLIPVCINFHRNDNFGSSSVIPTRNSATWLTQPENETAFDSAALRKNFVSHKQYKQSTGWRRRRRRLRSQYEINVNGPTVWRKRRISIGTGMEMGMRNSERRMKREMKFTRNW